MGINNQSIEKIKQIIKKFFLQLSLIRKRKIELFKELDKEKTEKQIEKLKKEL